MPEQTLTLRAGREIALTGASLAIVWMAQLLAKHRTSSGVGFESERHSAGLHSIRTRSPGRLSV